MKRAFTNRLIVCGLCAALSPLARPQVTKEKVQRWFDTELERAQVMPDLGDASIVWREDVWYVPPVPELNRLRTEVPGHPDHPRRFDLVEYERRVRGEPSVRRYQLWIRGDGRWRYCNNSQVFSAKGELSALPDYYVDSIKMPDSVWRLSAEVLTTAPPGFEDDEVKSIEDSWRVFWPQLSLHMFGGLGDYGPIRCRPGPVEWDGRKWLVTLSLYEDKERTKVVFAKEIRGVWDAEADRGFVQTMRIVRNPDRPESVGEENVFSDWRRAEHAPDFFAFKVEKKTASGARERNSVIEEIRRNEPGTFDRVTTAPSAGGMDLVRGPSTFGISE